MKMLLIAAFMLSSLSGFAYGPELKVAVQNCLLNNTPVMTERSDGSFFKQLYCHNDQEVYDALKEDDSFKTNGEGTRLIFGNVKGFFVKCRDPEFGARLMECMVLPPRTSRGYARKLEDGTPE